MVSLLGPGQIFHSKIVDLIYKLIFYGIHHIDFTKISYFSLVFAAKVIVFEYYQEHNLLGKMIEIILYNYSIGLVIEKLDLSFTNLFEISYQENKYI